MKEVERVRAEEAHKKVQLGDAILVCAYEDEAKCRTMKLEGSIFLKEFESMVSELSKDREIIFYCT